jgi:hypothetical protein
MNKISIIYLSFLTLISFSCASQSSEKDKKIVEVEKFVLFLMDNKPDKIYKMVYHFDSENVVTNDELREAYVAQVSKILKANGLPPKEKWIYNFEPNNQLNPYTFKLPLSYDPVSNKLCNELLIKFPPLEISDKISDFSIETNMDCVDFPALIYRNKGSIKVNNNNR